jgi:hypothetical protein
MKTLYFFDKITRNLFIFFIFFIDIFFDCCYYNEVVTTGKRIFKIMSLSKQIIFDHFSIGKVKAIRTAGSNADW